MLVGCRHLYLAFLLHFIFCFLYSKCTFEQSSGSILPETKGRGIDLSYIFVSLDPSLIQQFIDHLKLTIIAFDSGLFRQQ